VSSNVRRGDEGAKRAAPLTIKVAYGVRRGSSFSRYNPADFRLGLGEIDGTPVPLKIARKSRPFLNLATAVRPPMRPRPKPPPPSPMNGC
jgi:hypothetical protein